MKEKFYNQLIQIISKECVQRDELLAKYTTFKIGGPVDFMVTVDHAEELSKVLCICNEYNMPYYIMGKGSNLLVSDQGYRGVVIRLANGKGIELLDADDPLYEKASKLYGIEPEELAVYRCQAGVSLIAFALEVSRAGYTGFEFATGIPGSLGGAVAMNAGAYDGEMNFRIVEATAVDSKGNITTYSKEELNMGYRTCIVQKNGSIVTEAVFAFPKGDKEAILARVRELGSLRAQKQPLEYPSAGSTFKRPVGHYAGKLIMDAGLRGFSVGGAQISEKHCGFVINKDNATAQDVIGLIRQVQSIVKDKFGVTLETEVRFLGEF